MTEHDRDDLVRQLERLPREAWERPEPPPSPFPRPEPRSLGRLVVLRPMVAAVASVALLAVGVATGLLVAGDDRGVDGGAPLAGANVVELDPVGPRARGASAVAVVPAGAGGDARVRVTGLRPSTDDDFYEVWLLGEDGRLVALGSFRVPESGSATVELPVPVDPSRFDFVDVSLEPTDGDPSHSTVSVLRGPAT